jgi:hypothetical protein
VIHHYAKGIDLLLLNFVEDYNNFLLKIGINRLNKPSMQQYKVAQMAILHQFYTISEESYDI